MKESPTFFDSPAPTLHLIFCHHSLLFYSDFLPLSSLLNISFMSSSPWFFSFSPLYTLCLCDLFFFSSHLNRDYSQILNLCKTCTPHLFLDLYIQKTKNTSDSVCSKQRICSRKAELFLFFPGMGITCVKVKDSQSARYSVASSSL